MRTAWIISCGTELTLGQTVDTNAAWLAAQLAALGIRAVRFVTVADDAAALRDAVQAAVVACDVVLITGGLGPTADDLTREALALAARVPLELHPPSLDQMRAFFAARGREMPASNAVQAQIPRGATALPNTCGTAPGVRMLLDGKPCYALPGVPFEMRVMFTACVAPELLHANSPLKKGTGTAGKATGAAAKAGRRGASPLFQRTAESGEVILSRQLHTLGLGESELGARIKDLMQRGRNPEVGTTAQFGQVGIRLNAAAPARGAAETLLNEIEAELHRRLGNLIFGRDTDTLGSVVGALLLGRSWRLSTAESCTGGLIGQLLTDVPGSSRYYAGGVVAYADQVKADLLGVDPTALRTYGAVSAAVAHEMADGAAHRFQTQCAVAVTGIAGPQGGTEQKPVGLVYIGLHTPAGTQVQEFRFGADAPREAIRRRAALAALNMLRLALLTPAPG